VLFRSQVPGPKTSRRLLDEAGGAADGNGIVPVHTGHLAASWLAGESGGNPMASLLYWEGGAQMKRKFYFNTENHHAELDPDGTELASVDQARRAAIELTSGMLMNGGGGALLSGKPLKVWVTDGPSGTGRVLFQLHVSATKDKAAN